MSGTTDEPGDDLAAWRHAHDFGQGDHRPGERRTRMVVALTAAMMVGEILAGLAFGSMALLADGLHMASHTVALGLALFAYVYARRHAHDVRFNFGTGKVNALGGFSGALLLAVFAAFMAIESVARLLEPVSIRFDQAIFVAVLGLAVNVACAWLLRDRGHDGHDHDAHVVHGPHGHDHNLRSAYLHVLADAVTSLAAIAALLAGRFLDWSWMDPAMGLVGAALVAVWAVSLVRSSSAVLLDHQAPEALRNALRDALEERAGDRVADLHVWSIGPRLWAASAVVVSDDPRPAARYRQALPEGLGLVHTTIEVHAREP